MERIVKQIRKIKIYVPKYYIDGGMGFRGSWANGITYYEGDYTNKTEMDKKIEEAKAHWEIEKHNRWGASMEKVIVNEWWEIVEIISETP
jgi:hypothetical protein